MEIVARNLTAGHGGRPVLSQVDLALRPGEVAGLIGANGAGKSTLLRTLAGLAPPLGGDLLYDGRPAARMGERERARRLAYLAQDGEVSWALSVAAVVGLGRLPHRSRLAGPAPADRRAVERALSVCEVTGLAERQLATLSGGERSRVLLARALAVEAEMLLADEPIASLDPLHQLTTLTLLREVAGRGTGVAVVLHDLGLAARFCDRLVLVASGRILADGPPDAVLTDKLVEEAFGVSLARADYDGQTVLVPWRPAKTGEASLGSI